MMNKNVTRPHLEAQGSAVASYSRKDQSLSMYAWQGEWNLKSTPPVSPGTQRRFITR